MSNSDQITIEKFAALVDDAVRHNQLSDASKLSAQIKSALKQNPDLQAAATLSRYLHELQFIRFLAISESELSSLFSHHLHVAYEIPDYDFIQHFGDRFAISGFPVQQAEFLQQAITALESNDELLGNKTLAINNEEQKQTIGNWISKYNDTSFKERLRGQLQSIEFIEKNGNSLSDDDKYMLNQILKIYNGSKNWLAEYNSLPEATENDDIPDSVLLDMLYGPEEGLAPAVRQGDPRNFDGVKPAQAQKDTSTVSNSKEAQQEPAVSIADNKVNPQNASRLQELLHKNTPVKSENDSTPQVSADAIEAKLEELKNRVNKE